MINLFVGRKIKPSAKEKDISSILSGYNVSYIQEATHNLLFNPKTNYALYYDFYIPSKNIIIEYDGEKYHTDEDVLERDRIKNEFAKKHNFKLFRYDKSHNLKKEIQKLIVKFNIDKIPVVVNNPVDIDLNTIKEYNVNNIKLLVKAIRNKKLSTLKIADIALAKYYANISSVDINDINAPKILMDEKLFDVLIRKYFFQEVL
jgi:hypothetical protein